MTINPPTQSQPAPATLILTRAEIAALMSHDDYIAAAEEAFAAVAQGRANVPPPLHIVVDGGGFHGKGASLRDAAGRSYAAVKVNANFPRNRQSSGLPTIQGAILLFDAENGRLLAVMDSIEVTLQRTAAASALAARYLARKDSVIATVVGCGDQARAQLAFLAKVLPIARIHAVDLDLRAARAFAAEMTKALQLDVRAAHALAEAAHVSDVIVTCTTSRAPLLRLSDVRPGTFIAAVGADSPDKAELFPDLMSRAKVVVDSLEQCLVMGDLHHAVTAGAMSLASVHATLPELVAAQKPGRTNDQEIAIFDSTGTAVQDVAAALRIYKAASAAEHGLVCRLGQNSALMASTAPAREP